MKAAARGENKRRKRKKQQHAAKSQPVTASITCPFALTAALCGGQLEPQFRTLGGGPRSKHAALTAAAIMHGARCSAAGRGAGGRGPGIRGWPQRRAGL